MTRCHFCSKEIDPDARSTYRSIEGWEGKRSKGGANQIKLREETGKYAHSACVVLEVSDRRRRITPGQTSFL